LSSQLTAVIYINTLNWQSNISWLMIQRDSCLNHDIPHAHRSSSAASPGTAPTRLHQASPRPLLSPVELNTLLDLSLLPLLLVPPLSPLRCKGWWIEWWRMREWRGKERTVCNGRPVQCAFWSLVRIFLERRSTLKSSEAGSGVAARLTILYIPLGLRACYRLLKLIYHLIKTYPGWRWNLLWLALQSALRVAACCLHVSTHLSSSYRKSRRYWIPKVSSSYWKWQGTHGRRSMKAPLS